MRLESEAHPGVAQPFLLLAGIPGTGKSTFGGWLETQKGFVHIDLEKDDIDRMGLRAAWEAFWQAEDLKSFPEALALLARPVVLDWGFPPSLLGVVANLRNAGAQLLWFDGDRLWARNNCVNAKGAPAAAAFDCQQARISAEWAPISALFGNRIIRTVGSGGEMALPEDIWSTLSVWSALCNP